MTKNSGSSSSNSIKNVVSTLPTLCAVSIDPDDPYANIVRKCFNWLDELYNDLSANVTFIYGRHDLHLAFDLAYHSAVKFSFMGQRLQRGWVEVFVIGDTRTGKSTIIERMLNHYGSGEKIAGENVTHAGLVGGIDEGFSMRFVRWGMYPRNDKGFLCIDEVQEINPEILVKLSNIRSSGVAEITKIRQMRAHARTRAVWLANPRDDKTLDQFPKGVEAVRQVIQKPEDMARFDFAISAAQRDIDSSIFFLRKSDLPIHDHRFTPELSAEWASWVWGLRYDDIVFVEDAEDVVVEYARRMVDEYSSDIPLVIQTEQKIKVARLAVALAARVGSYDIRKRPRRDNPKQKEERITLLVHPYHVATVYYYLRYVYNKPSFQYNTLSEAHQGNVELIKNRFRPLGQQRISAILQESTLSRGYFTELLQDKEEAHDLWAFCLSNGALERHRNYRRGRSFFLTALRQLEKEDPPTELPTTQKSFDGADPDINVEMYGAE